MEPLKIKFSDLDFSGVETQTRDELFQELLVHEQELLKQYPLKGVLRREILKAIHRGELDEQDETVDKWLAVYATLKRAIKEKPRPEKPKPRVQQRPEAEATDSVAFSFLALRGAATRPERLRHEPRPICTTRGVCPCRSPMVGGHVGTAGRRRAWSPSWAASSRSSSGRW